MECTTGLKYLVIKVCRTVLGKAVRIISSEGKSIAPCLRSRALRVVNKRTTQLNRGMSEATLDRSRNSGFDRILIPE